MHTEEEAKKLWCPMVRHEGDSAGSFNRGWHSSNPLNQTPPGDADGAVEAIHGNYTCNCLASGCALWRWDSCQEQKSIPCTQIFAKVEIDRPPEIPMHWSFHPYVAYVGYACWKPPKWTIHLTGSCGLSMTLR
jgi:hypothetical protein